MKRDPVVIALRAYPVSNTSVIAWFLSPSDGLIRLMAKGHRRFEKRGFEGGIDIGSVGEIVYIPRRDDTPGILAEWAETHRPDGISESRGRFAAFCAACDFVALAAQPGLPAPELFALLIRLIDRLQSRTLTPDTTGLLLFGFLTDFFKINGIQLRLDRCAICGQPPLPSDRLRIAPSLGGLVIARLLPPSFRGAALPISPDARAILQRIARDGVRLPIARLKLSVRQRNNIVRVLFQILCDLFERMPRSLRALYRSLWPGVEFPRAIED